MTVDEIVERIYGWPIADMHPEDAQYAREFVADVIRLASESAKPSTGSGRT